MTMRTLLLAAALFAGTAACSPMAARPMPGDSGSGIVTLSIGARGHAGGLILTPIAIVEDSRCPSTVQCIQAGTIRVETRVERDGETSTVVLKPYENVLVAGHRVALLSACPYPSAPGKIAREDYRLTFTVMPPNVEATVPVVRC